MKTALLMLLLLGAAFIPDNVSADWYNEGSYVTPSEPTGRCIDCGGEAPSNNNSYGDGGQAAAQERAETRARNAVIDRYNGKIEESDAAVRAGNYREAARLRREAVQIHDEIGETTASRTALENAAIYERYADSQDASNAGAAAYSAGNYALALEYYRIMVQNPDWDNQNNRDLITNTEALVKQQERVDASKRDASRMSDRMNEFASSLDGKDGAPQNMEFGDPAGGAALEFGDPAESGAITAFPQSGVPQAEAALAKRDFIPAGTNAGAGAQLKSIFGHGMLAGVLGNKEEASKGFDTAGRENGALVYGETSAGRPSAVFTSLPDAAKNDTQVLQSIAYYKKLESLQIDTVRKIEALKAEQKSGKGDAVIIEAQLGTLTNDQLRQESDQAKAKETVKKRVKDLGFDWNESAPSAAVPAVKK